MPSQRLRQVAGVWPRAITLSRPVTAILPVFNL